MRVGVLALALFWIGAATHAADSDGTARCHPTITRTIRTGNLDTDRAREEIAATNVSCAHDYSLSVIDQCAYHRQSHWLRGSGAIAHDEVLEANERNDGRELFYVLRRGDAHAPDIGTAGLLHLRRIRSTRCPTPRFLFLYRGDEPLLPPPAGFDLTAFEIRVMQLSTRYLGKELRLRETFRRGQEETRRTTLLRYSARADRYVIYRPKL
jgi:hypothetical protein